MKQQNEFSFFIFWPFSVLPDPDPPHYRKESRLSILVPKSELFQISNLLDSLRHMRTRMQIRIRILLVRFQNHKKFSFYIKDILLVGKKQRYLAKARHNFFLKGRKPGLHFLIFVNFDAPGSRSAFPIRYGSGSRTARSMRTYEGPDPQTLVLQPSLHF